MYTNKFSGTVNHITESELVTLLGGVLDPESIKLKVRIFEEEITYADSKVNLYIQTAIASAADLGKSSYLLNGDSRHEKKICQIFTIVMLASELARQII
jgi:hypothetical protein